MFSESLNHCAFLCSTPIEVSWPVPVIYAIESSPATTCVFTKTDFLYLFTEAETSQCIHHTGSCQNWLCGFHHREFGVGAQATLDIGGKGKKRTPLA